MLLADEPTGTLDSKSGESVMELLRELHAGGATICMVTHDPRYARDAGDTCSCPMAGSSRPRQQGHPLADLRSLCQAPHRRSR